MENIKRLKVLILLAIGIALLAYSLLATNSFMVSTRAILMIGSQMQPATVFTDRIVAAIFLLFIMAVGLALIGLAVKDIIRSRKK